MIGQTRFILRRISCAGKNHTDTGYGPERQEQKFEQFIDYDHNSLSSGGLNLSRFPCSGDISQALEFFPDFLFRFTTAFKV